MSDQLFYKRRMQSRNKRETRRSLNISQNPRILIICEGTKTEPKYFEGMISDLRLTSINIDGKGRDPQSIVECAKKEIKNYDEIWCVFDRDDFPKVRFNASLEMANAKKDKIKIGYTNEAFELWYLLHFDYHSSAISRDDLIKKLKKKLGKYEKNMDNIYEQLLDKQDTAIKNAKKLYSSYPNTPNPEKDNPSTTVHLLVERLNGLAL